MPDKAGTDLVDLLDHPVAAKARIGYLPETPPLYPDMTVREYLTFVAKIKGVPRAERKKRVDTSMERTRVADMAAYRQFIGSVIWTLPGVRETRTYAVMEEVKSSTHLNLR